MPVSLPLLFNVRREARPTEPRTVTTRGFIVHHPRYRAWLLRAGVASPLAALNLTGEIVCGHPARHVARVVLAGGRVVYLKREHVVGWPARLKNARAGFGWVSQSEREAETLRRLETAGLPGPQWLAYGEDARGRAFLLVDEVADAADLRAALSDKGMTPADRRLLAERVGRAVAELHAAGFGTPDLAAKHVLIGRESGAVTLLDWPSAGRVDPARQLAGFAASLADDLATPRDRLRFLWAYRRVLQRSGNIRQPRFGAFTRDVLKRAEKLGRRSSARDQRQAGPAQRLVWLAGERACAIPEVVPIWPTPPAASPFYGEPPGRQCVTFPDGLRATLVRFATVDPFGRLAATLRAKPWRSPGATAGRVLFHLARYGVPAPRLLGFGQTLKTSTRADSFVLYEPAEDAVPVAVRLQESPAVRRKLLWECGALLRRLHDAGCRLADLEAGDPAFVVCPGVGCAVGVETPLAVRLTRRIGDRRIDVRRLAAVLPNLSRADRGRVALGYAAGDPVAARRLLLRAVA
jgi:tRNA A-37 threonylcarbamoyl transferase component Bud32